MLISWGKMFCLKNIYLKEDVKVVKKIIGVISDTHSLIRPEAIEYLNNSDFIIHAGDVGSERVLVELKKLAPVIVVKGNCDVEAWSEGLPQNEVVEINEKLIYVIHDIQHLDLDPKAAGISVVVYGHSHRPSLEIKENIYYLNPGSIGPRRFNLPISLAKIIVEGNDIKPEVIELKV